MTSYQTRSGQYRRLRRGKAEEVEEDKKKEMGRGEEDPVKGKERNVSTFHTTTVVVRTPPVLPSSIRPKSRGGGGALPLSPLLAASRASRMDADKRETKRTCRARCRTCGRPCTYERFENNTRSGAPGITVASTTASSSHHDAILDGRRRNQKLGEAMVMPRRAEEEGAGKGFWGGGRIKREEKRVWSIAFVDAWVSFETHLGSLC
ncbi:hypothetical protein GW17_00032095 [Ensete ventricosum]|nr:hypothetical protein GW17_00032095 [Ensete ventricosum]